MPLFRFLAVLAACFVAGPALAECRVGAFETMPERALIHLPAARSSAPMPLVMLLHGSTGTGAEMLRDSHLAETADRHGFVVVSPDGGIAAKRGYVWNIPGVLTVSGTLPPKDARDDVAYLTDLVDRLVATGCVDAKRAYLTGLSGGGRMASWLGCVAPGRFAGIAPGRRIARRTPARVRPDAGGSCDLPPQRIRPAARLFRRRRYDQPDRGGRRALLAIFADHRAATLGGAQRLLEPLCPQRRHDGVRARLFALPGRRDRRGARDARRAA